MLNLLMVSEHESMCLIIDRDETYPCLSARFLMYLAD